MLKTSSNYDTKKAGNINYLLITGLTGALINVALPIFHHKLAEKDPFKNYIRSVVQGFIVSGIASLVPHGKNSIFNNHLTTSVVSGLLIVVLNNMFNFWFVISLHN